MILIFCERINRGISEINQVESLFERIKQAYETSKIKWQPKFYVF